MSNNSQQNIWWLINFNDNFECSPLNDKIAWQYRIDPLWYFANNIIHYELAQPASSVVYVYCRKFASTRGSCFEQFPQC